MVNILKKICYIFFIFLLVIFSVLELCGIIRYLDDFINGYIHVDLVGIAIGEKYYGLEAIKEDGWAHIFYVPIIHIASIIQCLFLWLKLRGTKNINILWIFFSLSLLLNISIWILLLG